MTIRRTLAAPVLIVAGMIILLSLAPLALAGKGGTPNGGNGGTKSGANGGGAAALSGATTSSKSITPSRPSSTASTGCSISPSQVVLDQVWTVSAWGLPTKSTVNMIITFPNGAQSTGPITVASNGTYTTTGNSNMSATWGFVAPEQTGTYSYQFVNKLKWPAGTFTQSYAKCSVLVS